MAILHAIVGGERDAAKLAKLRDPHCHKSEAEISEQLRGHWREDHLFSLSHGLQMDEAIQQQITAYDREILRKLGKMEPPEHPRGSAPPLKNANKARMIRKRGEEEKRQALYRMSGVDVTQIDAVGVETVEVVLSEYGPDLSRFATEKQFVKHATLAPYVGKTGGKPVKKKRKRNSASSRVATTLRMSAQALRNSSTALGAYYRHLAQRKGEGIATFAAARKIATLIYRLLRWGQAYVDEGVEAYQQRYQQHRIRSLQANAKQLGFQLSPATH